MVQLSKCLFYAVKFAADNSSDLALSFSGCGFLGTYHFGVLSCLNINAPTVKKRVKRCAGASAGSLVAAISILAAEKAEDGLYRMYSMAEELSGLRFGAITSGYNLAEKLTGIVEGYIPEDISAAQDNLFISITRQKDYKNVLVSHFTSRSHLIECLAASCYIPMYSMGFRFNAPRPTIENEVYIDGGYSNNLPVFVDIPTITVSPFSGSALISPQDENPILALLDLSFRFGTQDFKVNAENILRGRQALFPPSVEVLREYFNKGYKDMLDFLSKNELLGLKKLETA